MILKNYFFILMLGASAVLLYLAREFAESKEFNGSIFLLKGSDPFSERK